MNPRARTMLGALVLCALSICALPAASASAAGLTAVECKEVGAGNGNYSSSSCVTPKSAGGAFETQVISGKTAIEGKGTRAIGEGHGLGDTANPVSVFHFTAGGVEITLTCGTTTQTGGQDENKEEGGEMRVHSTGNVETSTECHASPRTKPTKSCKVQGVAPAEPEGAIATNKMTAISGAEHTITVKPEAGETFTKFKILKSSTPECFTATDIEVTVTGEVVGRANTSTHAHTTFDEATSAVSNVKANGATASFTMTVTGLKKGTNTALGVETF